MKDMLIAFIICLVLGSIWNGIQSESGSAPQATNSGGAINADSPVIETTDASFKDDVLSAQEPVLVDFYATWCGPCKELSPTIDAVAEKYKGKVKFARVDVDKNPKITTKYGVEAMPTLKIFKNGAVVDQSVGCIPKEALVALLDKSVGEAQPQ